MSGVMNAGYRTSPRLGVGCAFNTGLSSRSARASVAVLGSGSEGGSTTEGSGVSDGVIRGVGSVSVSMSVGDAILGGVDVGTIGDPDVGTRDTGRGRGVGGVEAGIDGGVDVGNVDVSGVDVCGTDSSNVSPGGAVMGGFETTADTWFGAEGGRVPVKGVSVSIVGDAVGSGSVTRPFLSMLRLHNSSAPVTMRESIKKKLVRTVSRLEPLAKLPLQLIV